MLFDFLGKIAGFAKENFEPWEDLDIEDLEQWFLQSYIEGTLLPILVGDEVVAVYEYWQVTEEYIQKAKDAEGSDLPIPTKEEREGTILFFPVGIVGKDYLGKGFGLTKIGVKHIHKRFPDKPGFYRWMLKGNRIRFIRFKEDE